VTADYYVEFVVRKRIRRVRGQRRSHGPLDLNLSNGPSVLAASERSTAAEFTERRFFAEAV
jgi:hypothetical protein